MAIGNPHRGEVFIHLDARTRLPLVFNWDGIAKLRARWPKQDFDLWNPDDLAEIVSIGLRREEWTPQRVKEASPPMDPVIQAVAMAFSLAMSGKVQAPEENPRMLGLATLWKKLLGYAPHWASVRANSGN